MTAGSEARRDGASFRDPSGFVFRRGRTLYRQVNDAYREEYDRLIASGLYAALTQAGELIAHEEADLALAAAPDAYRVLRPTPIPFIAYPYEWCFGQLKDAALLTLRVQRTAIEFGMSLKDATAYNVQFLGGRPVLIDTLSFERLRDGRPWVAYRQFCEFFLAPLALASLVDARLSQLLRTFVDGIPIDLASAMLPRRSWLTPGLALHVHLHARTYRQVAAGTAPPPDRAMSRTALLGLLDSLERTVRKLTWRPAGTVWSDYYDATNYTTAAFEHKRALVEAALDRLRPVNVWDLGANVGTFSRLASARGIPTVAFDVDVAAVEKNYRTVRELKEQNVLPLLQDLTNPSGAIGWANEERTSLAARGPADAIFALALVHHLAIGHNVPLDRIAAFLASIGRTLIIEWVPRADSQVQRLLASRDDVFGDYTQESFERAFSMFFETDQATPIRDSKRTLYVMRRRS